jgi:hypothetical protein
MIFLIKPLFGPHFGVLKIFGIVIDGKMCGRKVMKSFRFVCNIILFDECVIEMKREKNLM